MDGPTDRYQDENKVTKAATFLTSLPLGDNELSNSSIESNKLFKHQIINQALKYHLEGNISEASKYYQFCLNKGFKDHRVFSNYGIILKGLGKLQEAEVFLIKAVELKPDLAEVHYNLGSLQKDLGKLDKAEISTRKATTLKPGFAEAHSNLGIILEEIGNLKEAEISVRKAIKIRPDFPIAHSNLGTILNDLGNLKEAEVSIRKAIELKPDLAEAYYNLGTILNDLGDLKEAEISMRKAIELKPDFAKAYYSLSILNNLNDKQLWQDHLFSENILNKKSIKDKVDIYFARANILHKNKNYEASSNLLQLANNLKLQIKKSNSDFFVNKSQLLLSKSNEKVINQKEYIDLPESIFIVGMPRSGSTLIESIISMNESVDDLGEVNILEESFIEWNKLRQGKQKKLLSELYLKRLIDIKNKMSITTNKWLYNYQYSGIIAKQIPNAKIIHCFRNPLDNILSIYRANFIKGNEYSSSLIDCSKVYLDQEEVMNKYKNQFSANIYSLNYDALVTSPDEEIRKLIKWLDWEWDDSYLTPHLNPRSVSTASNIEVRSPINTQSIGGWKNYKDMLTPAIEILAKTDRYKDIAS